MLPVQLFAYYPTHLEPDILLYIELYGRVLAYYDFLSTTATPLTITDINEWFQIERYT